MAKAPTMGRRAGTLHVRVIPDTRNFNKRLLAQLKRLEKQLPAMKVQINDAHIQKAHVRRALQRQLSEIRNLKINVDVDAELNNVTSELDQLRERNKKFDLVPELDKVMLERIVKQTEAAIKRIEPTITPNVDDDAVRAQVNSLARELKKLERDLKISVISPEHAAEIRHRINEIGDELDEMAKDRTVRVDINPFTAWASARLAWLTRPRMVEIVPMVSKAALAKAATAIAALSGARLSYDYMKRFSDWISEVDKKLPSLTFGTLGVTTAFSGLMAALSGLVGIGDGLAATLPSLLLIPGLLAGAAMSGVALFVALKESKNELAELGDSYTNLGEIIKVAFWGEARESIISLSNSIMPQLERSFDKTSLAIGRFTAKLMGSFQTEFAGGRLEAMFDGLAASWDELAKGTDAFAGAITNLGLVAARYMPRLATWFVRQADTFDNWLSAVATDGRLDAWIEESIDAFYALWDVMAATTGIFQGLWKAAEAAGSGGLRGFADMLLTWEEAVNGAKWQETLTKMFRGAGTAMGGFSDGLQRVGDMLHKQSDAIEYFMGTAGLALGDFLGDIADAFSGPAITDGLTDLVDGLAAGLEGLSTSLPELTDLFGSLLSFIGDLAEVVGPVLAEAFIALAPALTEVLDALAPLLPQLGEAFVDAIQTLTPLIDDLAGVIVDVLPGAVSVIAELVRYAPELLAIAGGLWLGVKVMQGFAAVSSFASGALGGFGAKAGGVAQFMNGPWGLAFMGAALVVTTALAYMDVALQNSTANTLELETAIKQGNSALETMADKANENEQGITKMFADVSQHFDDLPALADKAAEAGRGFWSTMSFNENAALDSIKALGDTLARLSNTDLPAAQKAFSDFVNDGSLNNTQALTFLNEEMGAFKLQLVDAANAAGLATDDMSLLKFALGEISGASTDANEAFNNSFDPTDIDVTKYGTKGMEAALEFWNGTNADPSNTSMAPWATTPELDPTGYTAAGQAAREAYDKATEDAGAGAITPWEGGTVNLDPAPFSEAGTAAKEAFDGSFSGDLGDWVFSPELELEPYSLAGTEARALFDQGFSELESTSEIPVPELDLTQWEHLGTGAGMSVVSAAETAVADVDLSATGETIASSLAAGVTTGASTVSTAVSDMVSAATTNISVDTETLSTAGSSISTSVADGITSASSNASTAATNLGKSVVTALDKVPADATKSGEAVASGFSTGITNKKEGVTTAGTGIGNAATSALSSSATGSYMIGVNFGAGFAMGMRSQIQNAANAAAALASSASASAKANLDVRSPSRVARDEIGAMFGKGFALGIFDQVPAAERAAKTLVGASVKTGKNSALSISSPFANRSALPAYRASAFPTAQSIQNSNQTMNVTANFVQPEERERLREFTAVLERVSR